MRTHAGRLLRTIATILTLAAERIDPQPPVHAVWPFNIHTSTGTHGAEARITWHETA
jgi:hypothetical protein